MGGYDRVTQLLIETCVWLELNLDQEEWPGALAEWWDVQKLARREVISRLAPAERELLGVSDHETFRLED